MWICRLWQDKPCGWESEVVRFETRDEAIEHGEWFINAEWHDGEKREYDVEEDDG